MIREGPENEVASRHSVIYEKHVRTVPPLLFLYLSDEDFCSLPISLLKAKIQHQFIKTLKHWVEF
jgi:hypothetical protein